MVLAVRYEDVVTAFRAEAEQLAGVMLALGEEAFDRPTACQPWSVADLLAHVRTAVGRLWGMLEEPAPAPAACVSAVGYYRPDARFLSQTNAARIAAAQQDATAMPDGHALATDFDRTWRRQYERVVAASPRRVVRTRHGDLMLLGDFLVTRVVELGVHGLDLAAALDRAPWLTPQAAGVVAELLVVAGGAEVVGALGWDRLTFVRKATGRVPLTAAEAEQVRRLGVRWLALG
jgi:uncharacterized protein (TIGR03083 family)